jgi:hypothetical protein
MGCWISGITDENFLRNLEQLIKHTLENKTIIYCVKYVDEIYYIQWKQYHNQNDSKIISVHNKTLQFTMEFYIINKQQAIEIGMNKKSTIRDIVISNNSCHSGELQMATYIHYISVYFMLNRKSLRCCLSLRTPLPTLLATPITLYEWLPQSLSVLWRSHCTHFAWRFLF